MNSKLQNILIGAYWTVPALAHGIWGLSEGYSGQSMQYEKTQLIANGVTTGAMIAIPVIGDAVHGLVKRLRHDEFQDSRYDKTVTAFSIALAAPAMATLLMGAYAVGHKIGEALRI